MSRPPALITSARTRAGYTVARCLAARGVPVYVADTTRWSMGFYSRWIRGHFTYPSPFRAQAEFVDFLNRVSRSHGIQVLVPVMEETFAVAKYRHALQDRYKIALADYNQLLCLHDKGKWGALAEAHGIAVPRTVSMEALAAEPHRIDELRFPVLLKPKQGGGGWSVREIANAQELTRLLRVDTLYEGSPLHFFNIQEKIQGITICVAMLYDRGRLIAKLTYEQLRVYPPPFGQATLRRSIRNRVAEENLRRLLDALNWHGICQADFLWEQSTQQAYLIDINPRFWGATALAEAAGIDFPYFVYRLALGEILEPAEDVPENIYCRWLGGDLAALTRQLVRSGNRLHTLAQLLGPRGVSVAYDDFSLRDPLPFLVWCVDSLTRRLRAKLHRTPAHDTLEGIWQ
jgi:predicted ATP-grasp superfamily ATP-dependent carboligase